MNKMFVEIDDVPGVIDSELLLEAIKEARLEVRHLGCPGPQDPQLDDIFGLEKLYIEFKKIARLDHLWMMTNLTELSLANNQIEKIENLEALVSLKKLNLSFNKLEKIENLENLVNIEVLSLYGNRIREIENLDKLRNLEVFTIGRNLIENPKCVQYLRRFEFLHSLNLSENPCMKQPNFRVYTCGIIPQLIYFNYRLITENDRNQGEEFCGREIQAFMEQETLRVEKIKKEEERLAKDKFLTEAMVKDLEGDLVFDTTFACDETGQLLYRCHPSLAECYDKLKKLARDSFKVVFIAGQENLIERRKRIKNFNKNTLRIAKKWINENRKACDVFFKANEKTERRMETLLGRSEYKEEDLKEVVREIEAAEKDFVKRFHFLRMDMMDNTMFAHTTIEERIHKFDSDLTLLLAGFMERLSVCMYQVQDKSMEFICGEMAEALASLKRRYERNPKAFPNMPDVLKKIFKEGSMDETALTCQRVWHHVLHAKAMAITKRAAGWRSTELAKLADKEVVRFRLAVWEVAQTVDQAKKEFSDLSKGVRGEANALLRARKGKEVAAEMEEGEEYDEDRLIALIQATEIPKEVKPSEAPKAKEVKKEEKEEKEEEEEGKEKEAKEKEAEKEPKPEAKTRPPALGKKKPPKAVAAAKATVEEPPPEPEPVVQPDEEAVRPPSPPPRRRLKKERREGSGSSSSSSSSSEDEAMNEEAMVRKELMELVDPVLLTLEEVLKPRVVVLAGSETQAEAGEEDESEHVDEEESESKDEDQSKDQDDSESKHETE